MRLNSRIKIIGSRVILVPYRTHHVEKYHEWMQNPEILEQTCSERLTLDQEFEMQKKWVEDSDKCTFIVLAKELWTEQNRNDSDLEVHSMIGDVNLFFNDSENPNLAEVEVMIAEKQWQRKGLGKEIVSLMMAYGVDCLGVTTFQAKIGISNEPSLKLFTKFFGFSKVSESFVFGEITFVRHVDHSLRALCGNLNIDEYGALQMADSKRRKIGIIGYGHLGQFLVEKILNSDNLELGFVWNLLSENLDSLDPGLILHDLADIHERKVDLVVEVAHPDITRGHGTEIVKTADYMVGSPTAFADLNLLDSVVEASTDSGHGVYIPSGAFWGGEDIKKMADAGSLKSLKVTMKKHPTCFKLASPLNEKNEEILNSESSDILFEGSVQDLCPLAPNNVNTMAAAAIAGHNLGFRGVRGCLVSDTKLREFHIVEVEVKGKNGFYVKTEKKNPAALGVVTGQATLYNLISTLKFEADFRLREFHIVEVEVKGKNGFYVKTEKKNPAALGVVTGQATYNAFFASLKAAHGKGAGVHLC